MGMSPVWHSFFDREFPSVERTSHSIYAEIREVLLALDLLYGM